MQFAKLAGAPSSTTLSLTDVLHAGKRPRMALADEDAARGDAGDEGPSTSGRDSNGATASGGVLPHRQYRGQRVETPSYPGACSCLRCLSPSCLFHKQPACRTTSTLHAAFFRPSLGAQDGCLARLSFSQTRASHLTCCGLVRLQSAAPQAASTRTRARRWRAAGASARTRASTRPQRRRASGAASASAGTASASGGGAAGTASAGSAAGIAGTGRLSR